MSNDKSDLILVPCSQSKDGWDKALIVDHKHVADFICKETNDLLAEGCQLAFRRPGVTKNETSSLTPALDVYTGFLYAVDGFRESILRAMNEKCHCLIISGGYGLLRPEEPINKYNAPIHLTAPVWRRRLSNVLTDYLVRNEIRTVFVACSQQYFSVLKANIWAHHAERVYCYVPRSHRGQGNRYRKVSKCIGVATTELIRRGMTPDNRWDLIHSHDDL